MQSHATNQLHIEMAHAHHTLTGFSTHSESFRQQVDQGLATFQFLTQLGGLGFQLVIGKSSQRFFQAIDAVNNLLHPFDFTTVFATENFPENIAYHVSIQFKIQMSHH